MKNLIKQLLREGLIKESYNESFEDIYIGMTRDIFSDIHNQIPIKFIVVPKNQYHVALKEYVKDGQFFKFPAKIIFDWKELLLTNISKLANITDILGHSTQFPFDDFEDEFDYNQKTEDNRGGEFTKWCKKMNRLNKTNEFKQYDWGTAYQFLDNVYHIDNLLPRFSNGADTISDYGTGPLLKLALQLDKEHTPEEIIVTMNKILDVAHQRSDLAELFIEGGSASLDYISNS